MSAELVFSLPAAEAGVREALDPRRARAIHRAAGRVIARLLHDAYEQDISDIQLEDRAQVAVDTFEVLLGGNARQLESVIDALEPMRASEAHDVDVEEARSRARLRLNALYRKVMKESLAASQLKEWGLSRQRLQQLRAADRLFAVKVPFHRELFHPAWQFAADHAPRSAMPQVIGAAKDVGLDAIGLHQLMNGERDAGRTGVQMLDDGDVDLAIALIRATDR